MPRTPTAQSEDERGAEIVNDLVRRCIWLVATLVVLRGNLTKAAAERGDEVLSEYDRRFDPIKP